MLLEHVKVAEQQIGYVRWMQIYLWHIWLFFDNVILYLVNTLPMFHDESPYSWHILHAKMYCSMYFNTPKSPFDAPVSSASTQRHVSVATLDCHYPNKLQPFKFNYNLYKFLSCFLMLSSIRGASVCYFLNSHCIYYKYKHLAEIDYICFKHANKEKFYVSRTLSLIGVKKFTNIQA